MTTLPKRENKTQIIAIFIITIFMFSSIALIIPRSSKADGFSEIAGIECFAWTTGFKDDLYGHDHGYIPGWTWGYGQRLFDTKGVIAETNLTTFSSDTKIWAIKSYSTDPPNVTYVLAADQLAVTEQTNRRIIGMFIDDFDVSKCNASMMLDTKQHLTVNNPDLMICVVLYTSKFDNYASTFKNNIKAMCQNGGVDAISLWTPYPLIMNQTHTYWHYVRELKNIIQNSSVQISAGMYSYDWGRFSRLETYYLESLTAEIETLLRIGEISSVHILPDSLLYCDRALNYYAQWLDEYREDRTNTLDFSSQTNSGDALGSVHFQTSPKRIYINGSNSYGALEKINIEIGWNTSKIDIWDNTHKRFIAFKIGTQIEFGIPKSTEIWFILWNDIVSINTDIHLAEGEIRHYVDTKLLLAGNLSGHDHSRLAFDCSALIFNADSYIPYPSHATYKYRPYGFNFNASTYDWTHQGKFYFNSSIMDVSNYTVSSYAILQSYAYHYLKDSAIINWYGLFGRNGAQMGWESERTYYRPGASDFYSGASFIKDGGLFAKFTMSYDVIDMRDSISGSRPIFIYSDPAISGWSNTTFLGGYSPGYHLYPSNLPIYYLYFNNCTMDRTTTYWNWVDSKPFSEEQYSHIFWNKCAYFNIIGGNSWVKLMYRANATQVWNRTTTTNWLRNMPYCDWNISWPGVTQVTYSYKVQIGIPSGWDENKIVVLDMNGTVITDLTFGSYVQFNLTNGHGYRLFLDNISADYDFTSQGKTVLFSDTSVAQFQITTWVWNFGDGQSSLSRNPTHVYSGYGDYNVTLTVTDIYGKTDSFSQTVRALTPTEQLVSAGNDLIDLLIWVIPIVIIVGIFTSILAMTRFKK